MPEKVVERMYNSTKPLKFSRMGSYPIAYLDKENSVLCPVCAAESEDNPDELEHFKPVVGFTNHTDKNLHCSQCGEHIEYPYDDEDSEDSDET